tara:strand:+ start:4687 stop:5781 length:1095 start_codon:yes stop_codon:yes gene_type:complete
MIEWCKKCVLPNTRPNLKFNSNGICSACVNNEKKRIINWDLREKKFKELVKKIKKLSKGYDCLIPVSGGKDSTWQVLKAKKFGLKILAFTWKTPFRTKIGQQNLNNLVNLGVDHIDWTINPKLEKKITKKTFRLKGSTAITMHSAIFNLPLTVASNFNIPLVLWGENSSYEYGDDKNISSNYILDDKWKKKYGVTNDIDLIKILKKEKNIFSNSYNIFNHSKKNTIFSVFLGHFFKWDPLSIYREIKKFGFSESSKPKVGYYNFADIDDDCIMPIHHWLKWYKFGFTRKFDNLSIEIRNNRMSRLRAVDLLKKENYKPPLKAINKFCKYYGFSKKEFFRICEKFRNKRIWEKKNKVFRLKKFIF